jgi:tellurite resistance protein
MDVVFGLLITLVMGWWILTIVVRVMSASRSVYKGGKAVVKTVAGTGSLSENWDDEFKEMRDFEIRLKNGVLEPGSSVRVKKIEARGLFPVGHPVEANIVVTAWDSTGADRMPIFTFFEVFQEEDTIALRFERELARLRPGYGLTDWAEVGVVFPDMLHPPYSGAREITVAVWLVNAQNSPPSRLGYIDPHHSSVLWVGTSTFSHNFDDDGYAEASEKREASLKHTITIAMAVAMADGTLDDSEGAAIKSWATKMVDSCDEDQREERKSLINGAMRVAHEAAMNGSLSLDRAIDELNEIDQKSPKYETVKLCFDVMAADGVADPAELQLIRSISKRLDLDFTEVERMRDSAVLQLDASISEQASLEDMLGIDPSWDRARIQRHIEEEFMKWNGRLGALTNNEERAQAQRMIDLCGKADAKYG